MNQSIICRYNASMTRVHYCYQKRESLHPITETTNTTSIYPHSISYFQVENLAFVVTMFRFVTISAIGTGSSEIGILLILCWINMKIYANESYSLFTNILFQV